MSETKWTKGPWKLKIRWGSSDETKNVTVAEIEADDGPFRGDIARLQSCEHIDGIAREELIANANLMFAAPDLYAALIHARQNMPHPDQMIDEALAKARGEA